MTRGSVKLLPFIGMDFNTRIITCKCVLPAQRSFNLGMDSRMVPSDFPKEEKVTEVVGPKAKIMLTIRPRFHSYKCIFFEGNI
jgi:hypothetical protein